MSDLGLLPEGWAIETIGNLTLSSNTGLVRGAKDQSIDKEFSYFKMNNLSTKGKFELTNLIKVDATNEELLKCSLQAGDFIFNTRNSVELVGKCGVLEHGPSEPVIFNNNLLRITFRHINPRIISFWFNSADGKLQLRSVTSATTSVAAIYQKALIALEVPIPPLAEQKVIADKLDELLAQVESTKARLDAIPAILKSFRQSLLAAAVSGKLTEAWRGENQIIENSKSLKIRWLSERRNNFEQLQKDLVSNGTIKRPRQFKEPIAPDTETGEVDISSEWELVSVSEFAECLDNMRIPVKKEQRESAQGLYPYFGANGEVDKVDEYIFDDELVMVTEDETFYGRVKPIAYRYSGKCWVNNHAHVLKAPNKVASDYLCYSLMYYKIIPWLSGTTGRAKLTQAALNSLPIGLPPEIEQTEIVRRVEELFALADKIEAQVNAAQLRVNNLTQSILAKAFRGELTADWRAANPELICGDNSAQALLERIKAEREALTKTTKKPAKKASTKKVKA